MSGATPQEIEAEIVRTRAELRLTVDELAERLDPRTQANEAITDVKVAAMDVKRRVTGEDRRPTDPVPTTKGWVILGAGAAVAATVLAGVIRKTLS